MSWRRGASWANGLPRTCGRIKPCGSGSRTGTLVSLVRAGPEGICLSRRHELDALVQAYSPLRIDHVHLPGTDVTLRITRPYPVITPRRRFGPYWGEVSPSGIVLASVIARDPGVLRGRRVLELGPGVGVTAAAALQAGADLVVADAVPGSLAFCALNALENVGVEPKTIRVNWRNPLRTVRGGGRGILACPRRRCALRRGRRQAVAGADRTDRGSRRRIVAG